MPTINLIHHEDWEIYEGGIDDPVKLMFYHARRILDICNMHGTKYTFYAEIGHQLHMLNASQDKWRKYADTWESILKIRIPVGMKYSFTFIRSGLVQK